MLEFFLAPFIKITNNIMKYLKIYGKKLAYFYVPKFYRAVNDFICFSNFIR
ncbi:MAG: hypothetical protein LBS81_03965 [Endomicrobium sp.]|nr:hypothetical protein [Endomicrobium sp.]